MITPRRSSSRCPRRCTPCGWRAMWPAGPSPCSGPGPSGCSPSRSCVRIRPDRWSSPIPFPPNAPVRADYALDASTPDVAGQVRKVLGGSADIVFDCVAIQSSIDQAIAIADKGGTVMVVGVPARDVTVPLPLVQDHQIRIQGSATYLPRRGPVKTADFVTATRPLDQVAEAFELASSGLHVKVLVTVGER